jgi:DNA polymerase-1
MRILLTNEREGIRVNVAGLTGDIDLYTKAMDTVDNWIRKTLNTPDLELTKKQDLVEALDKAGAVTQWTLTPTGKKSTKKDTLLSVHFKDPLLASAIGYRNRLQTCLSTFMLPYLETVKLTGDKIHTDWNSVRREKGEGMGGARTGRLSSSPNFQNIPKSFYDKGDGYTHPGPLGVPELPLIRRYILPDKGGVFLSRDYNQQELRVLAHFENESLLEAYKDDPTLDLHTYVQEQVSNMLGRLIDRKQIKELNFGMVYGMGLGTLAERMRVSVDEAKAIRNAQLKVIPGLKNLDREIKNLGKSGMPITTWGGRKYYCEPPREIMGRLRTFEYKLLNYLIQGSSADCTKRAIINYSKVKKDGRFLVTVHDEINISVPKAKLKAESKILRDAMLDVTFDVPMLSEAKAGPNWADITKLED